MIGIRLYMRRYPQKLFPGHTERPDVRHFKYSFCQRPRLIKDKGIRPRQILQIIPSFHHYALARRRRDPAQECDRDRQYHAARACHYKEYQPSVYPRIPIPIREGQGRIRHHRQRTQDHHRNIDP